MSGVHKLASGSCAWSLWDGNGGAPPKAPFCCEKHLREAAKGEQPQTVDTALDSGRMKRAGT
jgi:hypothetical protein